MDGVTLEDTNNNSIVDDFLANVVLMPKKQLIKYNEKEKEYNKVLNGLSKKLKMSALDGQKKYQNTFQEISNQKNRVIDDYTYRIQKLNEQINTVNQKNDESISNLDEEDMKVAEQL